MTILFNAGKGKVGTYHDNVKSGSPANCALVLVALSDKSNTDATYVDLLTLDALLSAANTTEVTNTGYQRLELVAADLNTAVVNHTANRLELSFAADPEFPTISAGDAWNGIVLCYDPDTTSGTDSTIIPLMMDSFVYTPDGGGIAVQVPSQQYFTST